MTKVPKISAAEWEIMEVIWGDAPATASQVAEALCTRMDWSDKTVKTMISRLVKKGALIYTEEGKRYLYSHAFPREAFVQEESSSYLDRVFRGDMAPMLSYFVKNGKMTAEEIEELKRILDQEEGAK